MGRGVCVLILFTDEQVKCIWIVEELIVKVVTAILAALQLRVIALNYNSVSFLKTLKLNSSYIKEQNITNSSEQLSLGWLPNKK